MLHKIENWEYFPTSPAPHYEKTKFQRFDELVNRQIVPLAASTLSKPALRGSM